MSLDKKIIDKNPNSGRKKLRKPKHIPNMYVCKICDQEFESVTKFIEHSISSHSNNIKSNRNQDENQDEKQDVKQEVKQEENQDVKQEENQDGYQDGYPDGYQDGNHKCRYCEKLFSQAYYLKKHIHRYHEGQKDYKCEPCDKSFSQPHGLKGHIQTVHEGHKDHKCEP